MERKKTIIIVSIIVVLLGVGLYFYFSKKTAPTPLPNSSFPGESIPLTGFTGAPNNTTLPDGTTFIPGSTPTLPRLYELHKVPVAGAGFIEEGVGLDHTVRARYVERGLGHIYETPLATLVESRIVNETRSRISETLWGNGGKSVVIRFIDDNDSGSVIKTSILNIGGISTSFNRSTSTNSVSDFIKTEEVFLPDYIPFMATSEDNTDKLFFLENSVGSTVGSLSTFKNVGPTSIFSSAFNEWLPQFPSQKLVTLTTKPSATIAGHLFFLDTKTKAVTKILGGINGLTTLTSHDGKSVLYEGVVNGVPSLSLYKIDTKTTTPLSLQTFPEKCAWGNKEVTRIYCSVPQSLPQATYPDQWYQGLVSFSDDLWEIDTTTGNTQKIMSPSTFGVAMLDITNPTLSSNDSYLLFMNKITGTPWVYRVSEDTPINPSTEPSSSTSTTTSFTPSTQGMVKLK
ncbi:hypothetical protein AUJ77_03605 [Candidatus Nomurabacteria bacterium CG1_02_43_90]|uniref:Uncharacterized protein n=1 Tax=Candidatus Nomurabacteria bacterium CG1_02_43_90 TaxID=1805281 RepID=A0A1J4UZ45_9BACT|nr:MAG: hypothetical protein AUJ77_03605 [Candidatus Nomurabacteria bacterium CG1_02_43_90]